MSPVPLGTTGGIWGNVHKGMLPYFGKEVRGPQNQFWEWPSLEIKQLKRVIKHDTTNIPRKTGETKTKNRHCLIQQLSMRIDLSLSLYLSIYLPLSLSIYIYILYPYLYSYVYMAVCMCAYK